MKDMTELETIKHFKSRIEEVSNLSNFNDNYSQGNFCGIVIALNLLELSILVGRRISTHEQIWFKGGYQIARMLDTNEFEDIISIYDEICRLAENHFD